MTRYGATWLLTGEGQPIPDGLLIVDHGKVQYAGPRGNQFPDVRFGDALIIPGLVNAHTHLDLGGLRSQLPAPIQFTDWLKAVIAYRRQSTPSQRQQAVNQGIEESIQSGVTLLGDISGDGSSQDALMKSALRSVMFHEVLGLSEERSSQMLAQWPRSEQIPDLIDKFHRAISPHAPYSTHRDLIQRACKGDFNCVALHLAETPEEIQLLHEHGGPFRTFLTDLGVWHPENLITAISQAIECLSQVHLPLLIHGNYLTDEEIDTLPTHLSIVYCPRTHAYFRHQTHSYLRMLKRNINVALGTDSLASNPDLSILNEARFLWQRDKQHLDGSTVLQFATKNGAKALGFDHLTGTLAQGKSADFVVLPCIDSRNDPWEQLWGTTTTPSATYINGDEVYSG